MIPSFLQRFGSLMSADNNVAHKNFNINNIIQRNLIIIDKQKYIIQWRHHLKLSIIIKDDDNTLIIVRPAKCCRSYLALQR